MESGEFMWVYESEFGLLTQDEYHLEHGRIWYRSTRERGVRMERKCLKKQEGSVGIGRDGDSSAMATPQGDVPGGNEASEL